MTAIPFIPKKNPELPDHYTATIYYLNGNKEEIVIAEHSFADKVNFFDETGKVIRQEVSPVPMIEFISNDDRFSTLPLTSIARIEFDKNWSKIVEIRKKEMKAGGVR